MYDNEADGRESIGGPRGEWETFYFSNVNPDKTANRRTLTMVANRALLLLETNDKCRNAISSTSLDAVDVLKAMKPPSLYENSGLVNAGDKDGGGFNAYTFSGPIQGVTRGTIEFYEPFFKTADSAMGKGLTSDSLKNLEDRQVLILLHEIGHAARKWMHPDDLNNWVTRNAAKLIVDNQWDNASVNQYIYDNCFKK